MLKKIKTKIQKKKQKSIQNYQAYNNEILSWFAPEYIHYEKGKIWKISAIVITLLAAFLAYRYSSWTFSLVILTLSAVYLFIHKENPKMVKVIVSEVGIKVGQRHYPFNKINGYWLVYHPPYIKKLNIRIKDHILVDIPILLHQQDPAKIQSILNSKIPEIKGQKEPLSESLLRLIKI